MLLHGRLNLRLEVLDALQEKDIAWRFLCKLSKERRTEHNSGGGVVVCFFFCILEFEGWVIFLVYWEFEGWVIFCCCWYIGV